MRRRINWRNGDSAPIFGHMVTYVEGDGELKIVTGFPASAAEVAFSKIYNRFLIENYGYGYDNYAFAPEVYVVALEDDGITIAYKNIVDSLDVNYFIM